MEMQQQKDDLGGKIDAGEMYFEIKHTPPIGGYFRVYNYFPIEHNQLYQEDEGAKTKELRGILGEGFNEDQVERCINALRKEITERKRVFKEQSISEQHLAKEAVPFYSIKSSKLFVFTKEDLNKSFIYKKDQSLIKKVFYTLTSGEIRHTLKLNKWYTDQNKHPINKKFQKIKALKEGDSNILSAENMKAFLQDPELTGKKIMANKELSILTQKKGSKFSTT